MRRSILLTLVALGAVITLIGGSGLFAALTDTASTGTNSIRSAALSSSADLQLATATWGGSPPVFTCGTFAENLTSPFLSASLQPGGGILQRFCLRNLGSASVTLSARAIDIVNFELDCTGDEAGYDATCGSDAAGELGAVLYSSFYAVDCNDVTSSELSRRTLDSATTPEPLGSLGSGETRCFWVTLNHDTGPVAAVQAAQSDEVTWRYQFSAQA